MSDSEVETEDGKESVDEAAASEQNESSEDSEEASAEASDEKGEEKPQPQGEERRKAYRLNKVLGATLTSEDGDATKTRLFVIDISVSGFRATDHRPPSQDECEISIALSKGDEPFVSKMRVVWVKELTVSGMYQMGCEFVDTSDQEKQKLSAFIDSEQGKSAQSTGPKPIKIDNPWTML